MLPMSIAGTRDGACVIVVVTVVESATKSGHRDFSPGACSPL